MIAGNIKQNVLGQFEADFASACHHMRAAEECRSNGKLGRGARSGEIAGVNHDGGDLLFPATVEYLADSGGERFGDGVFMREVTLRQGNVCSNVVKPGNTIPN